MGETLFSFNRRDYHECQGKYRGDREQEYYGGDCWIEGGPRVEVRSERKLAGPVSIIRQHSASNVFFRRNHRHIREDGTDLTILWFLKSGQMRISDHFGTKIVLPGEFVLTRSVSPFFLECLVDRNSVHEVFHIAVPTHILRNYAPCDKAAKHVIYPKCSELTIAENILTDIFEDDDALSNRSVQLLVETALTLIGAVIRDSENRQVPQTLSERRKSDVRRFVEVNLSNPNLSSKTVSSGCGISQRYLSWLLQSEGTSFSELVWGQRMEMAKRSLANPDLQQSTIAEICYGLGFKSPAHFSRLFKRVFGSSPSEFREECKNSALSDEIFTDDVTTTLLQ